MIYFYYNCTLKSHPSVLNDYSYIHLYTSGYVDMFSGTSPVFLINSQQHIIRILRALRGVQR